MTEEGVQSQGAGASRLVMWAAGLGLAQDPRVTVFNLLQAVPTLRVQKLRACPAAPIHLRV